MIKLYDKETYKVETIYAILDDDHGYPKFLIRNGNRWVYRSAKHYITRDELNLPNETINVPDGTTLKVINKGCIMSPENAKELNKIAMDEKRLLKILGAL